jgi:uncharacterized protein YjbI with pentapeptide repeats
VAPTSWLERLPGEAEALDAFPSSQGDDALELRDTSVAGATLSLADAVDKPELVNVRLQGCDVAGFVALSGRADRVLVQAGRLRGVAWTGGLVRDAELRNVVASDLSFRFSTLRRVVFRDCELPGLDLTEVVLDDVRFERCLLSGAQFHRAQVKSLRIEGCDLTGAQGVEALAGAAIHPDDLLALAPSMAVALGITLEAGP